MNFNTWLAVQEAEVYCDIDIEWLYDFQKRTGLQTGSLRLSMVERWGKHIQVRKQLEQVGGRTWM